MSDMTGTLNANSAILPRLAIDFDLTYYVAGPMTGIPQYNYPAFEIATQELRSLALKVVSPHEVPWPEGHEGMPVNELWTYMMRETKKLTEQAGGLILLRGWPASKGALIELKKFTDAKEPIYYYDNKCLIDMNRWES